MKKHLSPYRIAAILATATLLCLPACKPEPEENNDDNSSTETPSTPDNPTGETEIPVFDATISPWNGETATDADLDIVGTDADLFYEQNTFDTEIRVVFDGETATVNTANEKVLSHISGAYVTLDLETNEVSGANVIVEGSTANGALKIYGTKKYMLTLNGADITSQKSPAINSQCKKRVYVHLVPGTANTLNDAGKYGDDDYYLGDRTADDEDRKGCFFAEGHLIFSGSGTLEVQGNKKHGIATDGYFYMRPGVTLAVTKAKSNGISVKGDEDDGIGIMITGGLLYVNVDGTAAKAVKTDYNIDISGGRLLLNTSGGSEYDADENDTSSPACLKGDGNLKISGGELVLKSTGEGGKGINMDGSVTVSGGFITAVTSGGRFSYNERAGLTSSPKAIKCDGDLSVSGGKVYVATLGKADGGEGIESKANLLITGGEIYAYASDDAINGGKSVKISGGRVYAFSESNDGIDSNGAFEISGGLVVAYGADIPEGGLDSDQENSFFINGGTVLGFGGTMMTLPSRNSSQNCAVYNNLQLKKGQTLVILDADKNVLSGVKLPINYSRCALFFSLPELEQKKTYTLSSGGTLSDYTQSWMNWYKGGTWSGGQGSDYTITLSGRVTQVGSGGGPGGH